MDDTYGDDRAHLSVTTARWVDPFSMTI